MILGVSRESIQRNILKDLYDRMGFPTPSSKTNEAKLYGRRIYFVGCNNERAVSSIQGSTLAIAYVDEAPKMPYPAWSMLVTRLRVPGAQLLATGNPEGPAHWLKKEYLDRGKEIDLVHWDFNIEDNPSLDPAYIKDTKASLSGIFYRRLILGEWAAAHGAIYDNFDEMNLYENPRNNPNYYIVGVDYGTTNATAAVLCAITPNQWPQIAVESEYYWDSSKKGRSKTDFELVKDIKEFIGYKSVRAIYVDPAAASLKLELRQNDLPVIDATNDVILGIKIVSKFISGKNLVIQKGCTTLREHLASYEWDSKAADRGEDKPVKVNDHICLAGDTLIQTEKYECEIELLFLDQTKGDLVNYNINAKKIEIDAFNNVQLTRKKAQVIELRLCDGNKLIATPDHKVLTTKGMVKIEDLTLSHIVLKSDAVIMQTAEAIDDRIVYGRKLMRTEIKKSKIKSIKTLPSRTDVYCLGTKKNGTIIANGIIVSNCDALRYAIASAFPTGELYHPDENLTIEQLRRKVYGDSPDIFNQSSGGYY